MNAPPRFESFMLYDGEKKIEVKKEVNVPGSNAYFIFFTKLIRRVPLHFEQRRSHLGQYPENAASARSQGNTCGLKQLK